MYDVSVGCVLRCSNMRTIWCCDDVHF